MSVIDIDNGPLGEFYDSVTSQSWYVGLQWKGLIKGNTLGMAMGYPTFVTDPDVDDNADLDDFVADGNYAWEWLYKFQVADNISVTHPFTT